MSIGLDAFPGVSPLPARVVLELDISQRPGLRDSRCGSDVRSRLWGLSREVEVEMRGWWCVRFGDALAWVEAASGPAAVRRSLELAPLGDWTDDMRELAVVPQGCLPGQCRPPRLHPGRPERQPSASPASSRTDAQATIASRRRLPCWAPRVRPRPQRLGRDLAQPPCAWQPRLRHSRYSFRPSRRRSGMGSVRSVLTVFPLHLDLPRAVFSLVRTASCPCGPATCRQRYGAFESALVVHRRLK